MARLQALIKQAQISKINLCCCSLVVEENDFPCSFCRYIQELDELEKRGHQLLVSITEPEVQKEARGFINRMRVVAQR